MDYKTSEASHCPSDVSLSKFFFSKVRMPYPPFLHPPIFSSDQAAAVLSAMTDTLAEEAFGSNTSGDDISRQRVFSRTAENATLWHHRRRSPSA
jgi:hypothetical protein